MKRYKIYPLHEREFIKVSYIPSELEVIWSALLGVWMAVVFSQEIVIPSYTFWQNLVNILGLVMIVVVWFVLIVVGFEKGFRTGSLNAYGFSLWMSIMVSLFLIKNYLEYLNIPDLDRILTFRLLFDWVFFLTAGPVIFGISCNLIYLSIINIRGKDKVNRKREWIFLVISSLIMAIFIPGICYFWKPFLQILRINDIVSLLVKFNNRSQSSHSKVFLTIALNALILLRILITEGFYVFSRVKLLIRKEMIPDNDSLV